MKKITCVFELESINSLQMLALLETFLKNPFSPVIFFIHGIKIDIQTLEKKVLKKKSWPSGLVCNGFQLRFGLLPALGYSFLVLEELEGHNSKGLEEGLGAIVNAEGFIQAWISDVEYDFWQNAADPLEYEGSGRSYSALPMRSNGLPPPLDKREIDTSGNPGRILHKQGYIEAVGSTMWLGKLLWSRLGVDKLACIPLMESHGYKVYECDRFVKVVASDEVFSDDSTLEEQCAIRKILFGAWSELTG